MTRFDSDVELTLELARSAREPSAADKERVLSALRARLGPVAPGASTGGDGTRAAGGGKVLAPLAHSVLPAVAVSAVLAGAIGFWLGAGTASTEGAAPHAAPLEPARAPAVPAPRESPIGAGTAPETPPSAVPPSPTSKRPKPKAARSNAAAGDTSFAEVVRALARAQRALERREPALALALLDEIDARFPAALLDEERLATRAVAWCASEQYERARAAAAELRRRRPDSMYLARIERSCGAKELERSP